MNITLRNTTTNTPRISSRFLIAATGVTLTVAAAFGVSTLAFDGKSDVAATRPSVSVSQPVVSSQSPLTTLRAYEALAGNTSVDSAELRASLHDWDRFIAEENAVQSLPPASTSAASTAVLNDLDVRRSVGEWERFIADEDATVQALPEVSVSPANAALLNEVETNRSVGEWDRFLADESMAPAVVTTQPYPSDGLWERFLEEEKPASPVHEQPAVSSQSPQTAIEAYESY